MYIYTVYKIYCFMTLLYKCFFNHWIINTTDFFFFTVSVIFIGLVMENLVVTFNIGKVICCIYAMTPMSNEICL